MTKNDIFLDSKLVHLYLKDTRSDLPSLYDKHVMEKVNNLKGGGGSTPHHDPKYALSGEYMESVKANREDEKDSNDIVHRGLAPCTLLGTYVVWNTLSLKSHDTRDDKEQAFSEITLQEWMNKFSTTYESLKGKRERERDNNTSA
ncbi:hypothetical protein Tco_1010363 [Tanacetum coccineum]